MSAGAGGPGAAAPCSTLAKSFDPATIERHWYPLWEARGYFEAGARSGRPAFSIQLPPPNVTGILHMGHAFNQTIMDALTRYHRMRGANTLWVPGIDHAGIATQIVVERQLEQQGTSRRALGRAAFVNKVWEWKQYSGDTIARQMRRLGASCDWKRAYFTMDEPRTRWVLEAFVRLHEQGLIYRGKRLVNWDPTLQSAVSDLEVEAEEEVGRIWEIRYPAQDGGPGVVVATTRPETMLGDVAVAVHPGDARHAGAIGSRVRLPLSERSIPVIADEFVDPQFGTGCVKITPAHDFNDFAVAQRHGLEPLSIFTPAATVNDNAPQRFRGLDRYAARKAVLAELGAAGLLVAEKPHRMTVPRCTRTGEAVEPMLSDQWYVAMSRATPAASSGAGRTLAQLALQAVESEAVRIVPEQWRGEYRRWLANIQDWCISRQLWWGHQIPAWYDERGAVYVARSEAEAQAKARAAGAQGALQRDPDVLDTWFSSALVPFSTLLDTDGAALQAGEAERFLPSSVLVTGHEILFFWVARMVFMTEYFTGRSPFQDVYIHGIVRDAEGKKMSKSEGNTIDPVDLLDGIGVDELVRKNTAGLRRPEDAPKIERRLRRDFPKGMPAYGADALRFTMAAYATLGRDINFDFKRCEGYRNFCNKLWNATRFVLMNTEGHDAGGGLGERAGTSPVDRWIAGELQRTIIEVEKGYRDYRLDNVAQAIYRFAWDEYCDWYLELAKVQLAQDGEAARRATRRTLIAVLETLLRLAHPLVPFITEELWQKVAPLAGRIPGAAETSIMVQDFPAPDETLIDGNADEDLRWLREVTTALRTMRAEHNVPPAERVDVIHEPREPRIGRFSSYIEALARLKSLEHGSLKALDTGSALTTATIGTLTVALVRPVDAQAERQRLAKELARLQAQIDQAQGRLATTSFVDNAPQAVVQQMRDRLAQFTATRAKVQEQLARLDGGRQ